jgi:hypothetical protein
MTSPQGQAKAMTAIEALLEDKPDAFKATVWKLAHQLNWDVDDPGFLMAIVTNQLKVLIQDHPAEIRAAMAQATEQLAADWRQLQAKLVLSAMKSTETARTIDSRLAEVRTLLDDDLSKVERLVRAECVEAQRVMAKERAALKELLEDERSAMTQQALALTKQQTRVIEAKTKELIVEGMAASAKRSEAQVNSIVRSAREKHYIEAIACTCLLAAGLMVTGWTSAWISRGQAEKNSTWGDIERWNQDDLKACIDAGKPTCNFHIQVPKE